MSAMQCTKIYNGFEQKFLIDGKPVGPFEHVVIDFTKPYEIPKGERILWELKGGDEIQVREFVDRLLTPHLDKTLGVIVAQGFMNDLDEMEWREKLSYLPEDVLAFVHLWPHTGDPVEFFQCYELLEPFHVILEHPWAFALPLLNTHLQFETDCRIEKAILLPPVEGDWSSLSDALREMERPFRVIPEDQLIYEWDGVEELLVFPEALSMNGKRAVAGFEAAGGSVKEFRGDLALR